MRTSHSPRHAFPSVAFAGLSFAIFTLFAAPLWAEEIWLHDGTRTWGLIQRVAADNHLAVLLPSGKETQIPLEDIISIRFLGRDPLLVQSGTQEFRFVNGGRLRGQILDNRGDQLTIQTAVAGTRDLDLRHFRGFVALPLSGFLGRKAEDIVESERGGGAQHSEFEDTVLDRQGGVYPGVLRELKRTQVLFDIDSLLQVKSFPLHYVKGIRFADAGRDARAPWSGQVEIVLTSRDGSIVQGQLASIEQGKWQLRPAWKPDAPIAIDTGEIALVQTLGARVQYLSQLRPVEVNEKTILCPPQPYQIDRTCNGDAIMIGGARFARGIGVHARSQLTFELHERYDTFRSAIGIDTRSGDRGSVKFQVLGDGKPLYESPVLRGAEPTVRQIEVSIAGIKRLTLSVDDADDLDLGDVANWGGPRVIRGPKTADGK